MNIVQFSIRNSLIVNLFLLVIIIGGYLSWVSMPQEMFPVVNLDLVRVVTEYEGSPPEEIEKQITLIIEEELETLADIDVITSESSEGSSKVEIKLKSDTDVDEFLRELRSLIDAIDEFPEEAETPVVSRLKTRFPVISVTLFGNADLATLYATAERVKRELLGLDGVASVGIAGDREWELWIIVDPQVMAARRVSLQDIEAALTNNLDDLPGGSLQSTEGDILLRGIGAAPNVEAVKALALRNEVGGGQLNLSEIAKVELRLEDAKTIGRFNGEPSVNLTVTKTAKASTIDVADAVKEYTQALKLNLPAGIQVGLFSDLSVYVKNRLDTVRSSGMVGLVLVLTSLYLFLNFRVAFITALGIPVSFLVAVILIHYLGYTINMISLFAFLIALGMIVDDAIIVTENIYRHMEQGVERSKAALIGGQEVFWPVVASTCTTVAAFMPMFGVTGTLGKFIEVIPVVVSAALIGSLIEAFVILPSHSADILKVKKTKSSAHPFWKQSLDRYVKVLRWALDNRYVVSVGTIAVLSIVITYAATRLPYNQFGNVEIGQFLVNIEAPNTYSVEDSTDLAKVIEAKILEVVDEGELKTMLTNVGVILVDFNRLKTGSNFIQLVIDLEKSAPKSLIEKFVSPVVNLRFEPPGTRERSTENIIDEIRTELSSVSAIQRFSILRPQGGPAGADIEIGVKGENIDQLIEYSTEISEFLERMPGVKDVRQDLEPGKLEYQYTLNDRGRNLGLTQVQIANAVRTGFVGLEVTQVNWQEDRYPVRVIYPDYVRNDSSALNNLPITLSSGDTVYLGEVADIKLSRGLGTILRRDAQRLAIVTAEVDLQLTTPLEVNELIAKEYDNSQFPIGYELLFLGEKKEANDSFNDMFNVLIISLAVIFFILAALFKSILDPFVIMLAIPFAIVGVIIGHMIFGYNLQFLSMIGFLALTGIVVNDSLILVDFAKKRRAQGNTCFDAVVDAGRVRIRPILLTTVTTFLGISPLIFFASGQTAFLSPMAVSLGFGLVFATVLILIVVPCFYMVMDDLRNFINRHLWQHKPEVST